MYRPAAAEQAGLESFTINFKGRILGLDALRGIAVAWVIWHNVIGDFPLANWIAKIIALFTHAGWVGVQIFFVLSGFLITGILLDLRSSPARISDKLKFFYWRRSVRIFPLYYATLLFCFFLFPLFGWFDGQFDEARSNQVWYWTYTVNLAGTFRPVGELSHFWSLAIEEQFYLIWPLAVLFFSNKALIRIALFLLVSALLFRAAMLTIAPDLYRNGGYLLTMARWDALAMGALLAVLIRDQAQLAFLIRYINRLAVFTVVLLASLVLYTQNFTSHPQGVGILNQSVAALAAAVLIFYCLVQTDQQLFKRVMLNPLLNNIGKYSYALYVLHLPVRNVWLDVYGFQLVEIDDVWLIPAWTFNFAVVMLLTYVFARISWLLIESPFLRLKDRVKLEVG